MKPKHVALILLLILVGIILLPGLQEMASEMGSWVAKSMLEVIGIK